MQLTLLKKCGKNSSAIKVFNKGVTAGKINTVFNRRRDSAVERPLDLFHLSLEGCILFHK